MKNRLPLTRLVTTMLCCAALSGLAACTDSTKGIGTPVAAPASSAAPSSGKSSAPSLPPSPTAAPSLSIAHPVDLRKVRPCSLFTPAVVSLAHTSGDEGPPSTTSVVRLPHAPACFQFSDQHNLGLTLAVSSNTGLNSFETSLGGDIRRFTVHGYPAVLIVPVMQAVCFAGVGMADHQLLFLQYDLANPISQPRTSQARLCSTLRSIAQQAVSALTH